MYWKSVVLLVVIALGGAAVIGSYIVGLRGKTGVANTLWGGVPAKVRPVYGISMILSAVGFLAVVYYICLNLVPNDVVFGRWFGFDHFFPIFAVILVPSALWMPLSKLYSRKPRLATWIAIRSVLLVVGLASIALVWALFTLEESVRHVDYWFAAVGSCYFAFHTFVLDAIIWTWLFRRPAPGVGKQGEHPAE